MATDRLKLYNAALELCGETVLASLTEGREPRRQLDAVWDNDAVRSCLEAGQWNFATRSIELPFTTDFSPSFGLQYAYVKPDDFVRVIAVCSDERYQTPYLDYQDEGDYWFGDLDQIYVRYVSDDAAYGLDFAKWPQRFREYVEAYLASKIVKKLTADKERWAMVKKELKDSLADALSKDAIADPTRFAPEGNWVRARRGRGGNRDRSGGRLTG